MHNAYLHFLPLYLLKVETPIKYTLEENQNQHDKVFSRRNSNKVYKNFVFSIFVFKSRNIFVFWCYYVQTLVFLAEIVGIIYIYVLQMCSKVLQPSSLVVVFETLLSSAATTVDEEKGNPSWQACADFYITCILSCLPWGGAELMEVTLFRCCIYNLLFYVAFSSLSSYESYDHQSGFFFSHYSPKA